MDEYDLNKVFKSLGKLRNLGLNLKQSAKQLEAGVMAQRAIEKCKFCSVLNKEIEECAAKGHSFGIIRPTKTAVDKMKAVKYAVADIQACDFCSGKLDKILRDAKAGHP